MTIPRPLVTALLALVALPLTAPAPAELRSYDRVLLLESVSETSASVSLGDIDGNGTLDVVLAKGRHWPLNDLILRNDGHGKFTTELLADAPDRTYSAALADLDGDVAVGPAGRADPLRVLRVGRLVRQVALGGGASDRDVVQAKRGLGRLVLER